MLKLHNGTLTFAQVDAERNETDTWRSRLEGELSTLRLQNEAVRRANEELSAEVRSLRVQICGEPCGTARDGGIVAAAQLQAHAAVAAAMAPLQAHLERELASVRRHVAALRAGASYDSLQEDDIPDALTAPRPSELAVKGIVAAALADVEDRVETKLGSFLEARLVVQLTQASEKLLKDTEDAVFARVRAAATREGARRGLLTLLGDNEGPLSTAAADEEARIRRESAAAFKQVHDHTGKLDELTQRIDGLSKETQLVSSRGARDAQDLKSSIETLDATNSAKFEEVRQATASLRELIEMIEVTSRRRVDNTRTETEARFAMTIEETKADVGEVRRQHAKLVAMVSGLDERVRVTREIAAQVAEETPGVRRAAQASVRLDAVEDQLARIETRIGPDFDARFGETSSMHCDLERRVTSIEGWRDEHGSAGAQGKLGSLQEDADRARRDLDDATRRVMSLEQQMAPVRAQASQIPRIAQAENDVDHLRKRLDESLRDVSARFESHRRAAEAASDEKHKHIHQVTDQLTKAEDALSAAKRVQSRIASLENDTADMREKFQRGHAELAEKTSEAYRSTTAEVRRAMAEFDSRTQACKLISETASSRAENCSVEVKVLAAKVEAAVDMAKTIAASCIVPPPDKPSFADSTSSGVLHSTRNEENPRRGNTHAVDSSHVLSELERQCGVSASEKILAEKCDDTIRGEGTHVIKHQGCEPSSQSCAHASSSDPSAPTDYDDLPNASSWSAQVREPQNVDGKKIAEEKDVANNDSCEALSLSPGRTDCNISTECRNPEDHEIGILETSMKVDFAHASRLSEARNVSKRNYDQKDFDQEISQQGQHEEHPKESDCEARQQNEGKRGRATNSGDHVLAEPTNEGHDEDDINFGAMSQIESLPERMESPGETNLQPVSKDDDAVGISELAFFTNRRGSQEPDGFGHGSLERLPTAHEDDDAGSWDDEDEEEHGSVKDYDDTSQSKTGERCEVKSEAQEKNLSESFNRQSAKVVSASPDDEPVFTAVSSDKDDSIEYNHEGGRHHNPVTPFLHDVFGVDEDEVDDPKSIDPERAGFGNVKSQRRLLADNDDDDEFDTTLDIPSLDDGGDGGLPDIPSLDDGGDVGLPDIPSLEDTGSGALADAKVTDCYNANNMADPHEASVNSRINGITNDDPKAVETREKSEIDTRATDSSLSSDNSDSDEEEESTYHAVPNSRVRRSAGHVCHASTHKYHSRLQEATAPVPDFRSRLHNRLNMRANMEKSIASLDDEEDDDGDHSTDAED